MDQTDGAIDMVAGLGMEGDPGRPRLGEVGDQPIDDRLADGGVGRIAIGPPVPVPTEGEKDRVSGKARRGFDARAGIPNRRHKICSIRSRLDSFSLETFLQGTRYVDPLGSFTTLQPGLCDLGSKAN